MHTASIRLPPTSSALTSGNLWAISSCSRMRPFSKLLMMSMYLLNLAFSSASCCCFTSSVRSTAPLDGPNPSRSIAVFRLREPLKGTTCMEMLLAF